MQLRHLLRIKRFPNKIRDEKHLRIRMVGEIHHRLWRKVGQDTYGYSSCCHAAQKSDTPVGAILAAEGHLIALLNVHQIHEHLDLAHRCSHLPKRIIGATVVVGERGFVPMRLQSSLKMCQKMFHFIHNCDTFSYSAKILPMPSKYPQA